MAPPPATPSPRRFLTKPRPHHEPQPPSSLRTVQRAAATSSSQFAPTPRFSLSSARTKQEDDIVPSSSASASASPRVSRTRAGFKLKRGEEIEDSEGDERGRYERGRASGDRNGGMRLEDGDETSGARSRKRRRVSMKTGRENVDGGGQATLRQGEAIYISSSDPPSPSPSSSASSDDNPNDPVQTPTNPTLPNALPPTTSTAPATTTTHPPHPRFLFPPQTQPTPPTSTAHPSPTIFLLPTTNPNHTPAPDDPDPLPELFSPHRRGQKFMAGGLAATVRDWVVEVAQGAVGSRRRALLSGRRQRQRQRRGWGEGGIEEGRVAEGEGEGEGDGVCMRVREVGGGGGGDGGVVLVRETATVGVGDGGGGGEGLRNWMLVGAGGGGRVRSGVVVLVRAPVWEVDVRGERWGVGVEWRVVGGDG